MLRRLIKNYVIRLAEYDYSKNDGKTAYELNLKAKHNLQCKRLPYKIFCEKTVAAGLRELHNEKLRNTLSLP
jgi:hypothetical protein